MENELEKNIIAEGNSEKEKNLLSAEEKEEKTEQNSEVKNAEETNKTVDLEEAKNAEKTAILEEKRKRLNLLKGKLDALSETYKELEATKEAAIKKASDDERAWLEKSYDQKIVELDFMLKDEKKKKEKEKEKIIKEKIEEATKDKKERIYYTKRNIKVFIKEKNLSPFLNTGLYFATVAPKTIPDFIKGALIILITILVIPTIIVFLAFPETSFWTRVIIYIVNLFFWSVIHFFFIKLTDTSEENIRQIREMRNDVKEDEKTVARLTREIKNEKIENNNVYTKIDRKIETINLNIKDLQDKKREALENFEKVRVNEIRKNIEKESKKDFKENEKERKKVEEEYEKLEREYTIQEI